MYLFKSDEQALLSEKELPENIIIASQMLFKMQYPHIESLQDTFKGKFLSFQPVGEKKMSVQICSLQILIFSYILNCIYNDLFIYKLFILSGDYEHWVCVATQGESSFL